MAWHYMTPTWKLSLTCNEVLIHGITCFMPELPMSLSTLQSLYTSIHHLSRMIF